MAVTYYQMASNRFLFGLSIPRYDLAPILTQKNRNRFATRCEANNQVLQAHSRGVAIYQDTIWSHDFINGLETHLSINFEEKVKEVEVKVMAMIIDYKNASVKSLELLELIDTIERLGIGYRFRTSINRVLNKIVALNENNLRFKLQGEEEEENNLHALSLRFRILRQNGFRVSQVKSDFFTTFKERHGGLFECLETDDKVLLSIYEASYLLDEETDLHEARLLAAENLLKLNGHANEVTKAGINQALEIPLYRRIPRLEARWYIDAYGKQKDANQLLLELAILDFNIVQSAHKRELQELSKWWENIGLVRNLSFIRDRLMECFFGSVGMVSERRYYSCRVGLTKVLALITTIDDIYDLYGSPNELKVFTNAVKRWDINAAESMSEYIQLSFLALYNTVNEMCHDTSIAQGKNVVPVLAKVWGELLEAFLVEAKWNHSKFIPTFENYLDNAWRSASGMVILTHGYFLINQYAKGDSTDSLEKYHDLYKWSSMLFRLYNDLAASSDEIVTCKHVNAISCYMYQHGVCEEVAREYIKTLIDKAWMKMIEVRIALSEDLIDPLIDMAINLARVSNCAYKYGDGVKAPGARAKLWVLSVLIEPISASKKISTVYR